MINNTIYIVSGLPRSGTSMMMRIMEAAGLPVMTDNIRKSDIDNPKGYYEFEMVKTIKEDTSWVKDTRGKVFKMVSLLLYYLPTDEHYKIVFMHREMSEILASERQMLQRLGKKLDAAREQEVGELFAKHLKGIEKWLAKQKNMGVIHINYNEVLNDKEKELKKLHHFLGDQFDLPAMIAVVDQTLYRQRKG